MFCGFVGTGVCKSCIDVTSPILSDIPCILNEMSDVGIEISFGVTFSFKYKVNFLKSDPQVLLFLRENYSL